MLLASYFFFNDAATTEIYTLSLHDALPILMRAAGLQGRHPRAWRRTTLAGQRPVDAPELLGQDFTAQAPDTRWCRSEEHTSELQSRQYLVCRLLLEKKKSDRHSSIPLPAPP